MTMLIGATTPRREIHRGVDRSVTFLSLLVLLLFSAADSLVGAGSPTWPATRLIDGKTIAAEVRGEVYRIPASRWPALDDWEDAPEVYQRRKRELKDGRSVWVYEAP